MNANEPVFDESMRMPDVQREMPFLLDVDGNMVKAYPGETVAGVLMASGKRVFNYAVDGSPRGYSCGIGRCFSCLVTIDDIPDIRACTTQVYPGMKIQTGLKAAKTE
jgi:D-hydroxyproline dehydrogenase subunit gamma